MNKSDITRKLREMSKILGLTLLVFQENRLKRGNQIGMTDYMLVGKGHIIFMEGKVEKDTLTEKQHNLLSELQATGVMAGVITDTNCDMVINSMMMFHACFPETLKKSFPQSFFMLAQHYGAQKRKRKV